VRRYWLMKRAAFVVFAPALVALLSLVVMLLWNALIPSLFGGPVLGFWQAAGLLVLTRVLFGGFRPHRGHGRHHQWRQRVWRTRWRGMTPEERERFREGFRGWKDMSREQRRDFRKGFGGRFGGCGHEIDHLTPDELSEPS
jgi:hypothetical protein